MPARVPEASSLKATVPLIQVTGMRLELLVPDLLGKWNGLLVPSVSLLLLSLQVSKVSVAQLALSTRITAFLCILSIPVATRSIFVS